MPKGENLFDFTELKREPSGSACKGLFYRYSESAYLSSHFSIEYRRSYRFLKRMSCPGCALCKQIYEDYAACGEVESVFQESQKPVNGAIYEACFQPGAADWETGICDEWWWKLRRVEK